MSTPKATIQISKIAAAQRQLDAAIRMFFQQEDELAIHTVAAAAFQILRDVIKHRGLHFTSDLVKSGILSIAQEYAQGTLPPDTEKKFEGTALMPTIKYLAEDIREHGDKSVARANFIVSANFNVYERTEHKLWQSETTVFLKHANRDPNAFLHAEGLDNEHLLIATCGAYVNVISQPTQENIVFFAFWSAKRNKCNDLADEVRTIALQLQAMEEMHRYDWCARFIKDSKSMELN